MVWWSINHKTEPKERIQAALALSSQPTNDDNAYAVIPRIVTNRMLANAYNNAEELGLDLNSLTQVPDEDIDWEDDDE